VVESPKGVSMSCNMAHRICQLWVSGETGEECIIAIVSIMIGIIGKQSLFPVSGWYSRKTAGLLGTMDEEPTSDMTLTNGKRAGSVVEMVKSYDVSDDTSTSAQTCPATDQIKSRNVDLEEEQEGATEMSSNKIAYTCDKVFGSKMSSLQPCFSTVSPVPVTHTSFQSNSQNFLDQQRKRQKSFLAQPATNQPPPPRHNFFYD
jgi:hypothetical protein